MGEHTPTPWTLSPKPHASWIGKIGNNSADPQLWSVATPFPKGDKGADAALIIKAVNSYEPMLRMIQSLVDRFEGSQSGFIPGCGYDEEWCACRDRDIADARAFLDAAGAS